MQRHNVIFTGQVLRLQQRNTGKAFLLTLSMDNGITDEAPFIVYDRTTLIAPQGTLT